MGTDASPQTLDPDSIQNRLSIYLAAPLERIRVLASGWETTVYEFVLGSPSRRLPVIPTATSS